jgi:hypothetical protein
MNGQWQNGTTCVAPAHCANGACVECTAGDVRCNAAHDRLETCNGNGQWHEGMMCPNGCVDPGRCADPPDAGTGI